MNKTKLCSLIFDVVLFMKQKQKQKERKKQKQGTKIKQKRKTRRKEERKDRERERQRERERERERDRERESEQGGGPKRHRRSKGGHSKINKILSRSNVLAKQILENDKNLSVLYIFLKVRLGQGICTSRNLLPIFHQGLPQTFDCQDLWPQNLLQPRCSKSQTVKRLGPIALCSSRSHLRVRPEVSDLSMVTPPPTRRHYFLGVFQKQEAGDDEEIRLHCPIPLHIGSSPRCQISQLPALTAPTRPLKTVKGTEGVRAGPPNCPTVTDGNRR